MADTQTFDPDVIDETKPITFMPREWFFFKEAIDDQIAAGNGVDLLKALHAARYRAKLRRSFEQLEEGKVVTLTDAQWEAFVNEQKLH